MVAFGDLVDSGFSSHRSADFWPFSSTQFLYREARTFAFAKFASVRTCEYPSGLADLNDLDKKTSKIKKIIFNIFDK